MEYLGLELSDQAIAPMHSKINKIQDWPFPTTRHDMQSFLGLCNYYRHLIPELAMHADPLYKSTKDKKIEPTTELTTAFQTVKDVFIKIPTVKIPNPERPFILVPNGSAVALGTELRQSFNEDEYPVI